MSLVNRYQFFNGYIFWDTFALIFKILHMKMRFMCQRTTLCLIGLTILIVTVYLTKTLYKTHHSYTRKPVMKRTWVSSSIFRSNFSFLHEMSFTYSETKTLKERYIQVKPNASALYLTHNIQRYCRAGNQMFQVAALMGVSAKLNRTIVMGKTMFDYFKATRLQASVNPDLHGRLIFKKFEESASGKHDHGIYQLPDRNVELVGYFQAYGYFDHIRDIIKDEFTFKEEITAMADAFIRSVTDNADATTFIGIHIRRGDLERLKYVDGGYSLPGQDYFVKAQNYMRSKFGHNKIIWIVGSDSPAWGMGNLRSIKDEKTVFLLKNPSTVDLAILSRCNHTIMSVGSYSWWIAYLTGGVTVYYKEWPKNGSKLFSYVNKSDYFLPDWIGIA